MKFREIPSNETKFFMQTDEKKDGHTDRQTDSRYDEHNSRFSQFCEHY